ncbi:hypothetical protein CRENPOLYSF1_630009 [Crenothrix polyspora]|uniref:Uncharacterized protein n=1 Tax=Crenothrix polyspora TaxID=360316 RepID=A0A1R4HGD1_9GAMM|nr:hypothetical protein CRENPOLYSF1_630009 [Crenothrix polyspora]
MRYPWMNPTRPFKSILPLGPGYEKALGYIPAAPCVDDSDNPVWPN